MKSLFKKECFCNEITLEVKHKSSNNNGVSVKPKELKGIKPFAKINCRDKSFQLFLDNNNDLWYKDGKVIVYTESYVENNEVKNNIYVDKIWFKINGLEERKNQFILDTVRELSIVSENLYTDNTIVDNITLEDIYTEILKAYYKEI